MTNEADRLAGNRSEVDFNDEAPPDLPTKDGFDLAIFPLNTSSSEKLAAQNFCGLIPNTLEIHDSSHNDDHTMGVQLLRH